MRFAIRVAKRQYSRLVPEVKGQEWSMAKTYTTIRNHYRTETGNNELSLSRLCHAPYSKVKP